MLHCKSHFCDQTIVLFTISAEVASKTWWGLKMSEKFGNHWHRGTKQCYGSYKVSYKVIMWSLVCMFRSIFFNNWSVRFPLSTTHLYIMWNIIQIYLNSWLGNFPYCSKTFMKFCVFFRLHTHWEMPPAVKWVKFAMVIEMDSYESEFIAFVKQSVLIAFLF